MANTPESPFDKINRLLQQQNILNDQQSQEMQTAITSAVEDFPNRLADAQSLLNQCVKHHDRLWAKIPRDHITT